MEQNTSINILGIAPYSFLPAITGGQKAIAFFYTYLGEKVPVSVISTEYNDELKAKNFKLIKLFASSKLRYINLRYISFLKKFIRHQKITHIIIEHPYMGWLAVTLKKITNVKLIVRSHNIEAMRFKSVGKWWWRILYQYEKWVHRQADVNFFITDEDKSYAIKNFTLNAADCYTITYGTEQSEAPDQLEKDNARKAICELYHTAKDEVILLFNGVMSYKPNLVALEIIINHVNPYLLEAERFLYKIIVCGKDLPFKYKNTDAWKDKNILFAGFVTDINLFFLAADIFINPVIEGGGIKTKMIEALAYGNNVVSTKSGAAGIPLNVADNIVIVEDYNWKGFADAIISATSYTKTRHVFFEHFYWRNIIDYALDAMKKPTLLYRKQVI